MKSRSTTTTRRSGMSLVEVTLASTMFAGIGYVLMMSLRANEGSHSTVVATVEKNVELRTTTDVLRDELRSARASSVEISPGNQYSLLSFQTAIQGTDGALGWGAFDRRIAIDENECHRAGWRVRYEVVQDDLRGAQLVRRVIDEQKVVHCEDVLACNVTQFEVTNTGDVWHVRMTTEGDEGRREDEFDVRTRNR